MSSFIDYNYFYASYQALTTTIDAKDMYTSGHSRRVAEYSKMLAEALGKDKKTQQEIYLFALLHDIGKIGIPDWIINKQDKLTTEEYAEIKKHPQIGYEILKSISIPLNLKTSVRWHHERLQPAFVRCRRHPVAFSEKLAPGFRKFSALTTFRIQ